MPGWYYRLQRVRALLLVRLSQIWPDLVFRRNITNPAISEPVEQYFLSYGLFEARNLLRVVLQATTSKWSVGRTIHGGATLFGEGVPGYISASTLNKFKKS